MSLLTFLGLFFHLISSYPLLSCFIICHLFFSYYLVVVLIISPCVFLSHLVWFLLMISSCVCFCHYISCLPIALSYLVLWRVLSHLVLAFVILPVPVAFPSRPISSCFFSSCLGFCHLISCLSIMTNPILFVLILSLLLSSYVLLSTSLDLSFSCLFLSYIFFMHFFIWFLPLSVTSFCVNWS